MNNAPSIHIDTHQRLCMSKNLQQAISVLSMSQHQLEIYINTIVEQNPLLFPTETIFAHENGDNHLKKKDHQTNFADHDSFNDATSSYYSEKRNKIHHGLSFEEKDFTVEKIPQVLTLHQQLCQQAHETFGDQRDLFIANFLIFSLDPNGYLPQHVEEIASMIKASPKKITRILEKLKTFDPVGIFAANLVESLSLQLKDRGLYSPNLEKILHHLHLLEKNNIKLMMKFTGLSMETIQQSLSIIRQLKPFPISGLPASDGANQYITPEVFVFWDNVEEKWKIRLNNSSQKNIHFSQNHYEFYKNGCKKNEEKNFLNKKKQEAQWLFHTLRQRDHTLMCVAEAIVEYQQDFFTHGIDSIKPMTHKDIAVQVDLHESTISRITSEKYIQTPKGIFHLKFFFSNALNQAHLEGGLSTKSIRDLIYQLVQKEDKTIPLSDEDIVMALKNYGIEIARRTVAKYRGMLKIANSSQRRQIF
jgi:RNA polymerase sigma-54 factor